MPYVRTRLGRLFYEERGLARAEDAPAIVLLHGLLFDGGSWRGQVEPLARLGRVIVLDGPGHGRSEAPPRFVLEDHADALTDAFRELGITSVVLVGLSWGGMTAMRVALQHASFVRGLALLDTSAEPQSLSERLQFQIMSSFHRRFGLPYALFLREIAPRMFSEATCRTRPGLLEATYQRTAGFDRDGLGRASHAVVHRTNILGRLGAIRVPTLVMWGSEDRTTSPARNERIANAIPGAERVVLDGLGHLTTLEAPERVNEHLVPFVRQALDQP
ncbi:MAG: Beta-ketoadipate enol-lactone hydrolase [Labilithrix sp.]|nr:Beta-ketoadipate enol-lactone hydrolase [Labilithrix sp.]